MFLFGHLHVTGVGLHGGCGQFQEVEVLQDGLECGRGQVKVQVGPGGEVTDELQCLAVLSQHSNGGPFGVTLLSQKCL